MADNREFLEARVARVFRDAPWPTQLTNRAAEEDFESGQIAASFAGKHWRELTAEFLRTQPDAMAFLSPEAFRFYLPGYLILALKDLRSLDVALQNLLSALAGPAFLDERLSLLTQSQLEVTLAVLDVLAPPVDDGEYWEFGRAKEGILGALTLPPSASVSGRKTKTPH